MPCLVTVWSCAWLTGRRNAQTDRPQTRHCRARVHTPCPIYAVRVQRKRENSAACFRSVGHQPTRLPLPWPAGAALNTQLNTPVRVSTAHPWLHAPTQCANKSRHASLSGIHAPPASFQLFPSLSCFGGRPSFPRARVEESPLTKWDSFRVSLSRIPCSIFLLIFVPLLTGNALPLVGRPLAGSGGRSSAGHNVWCSLSLPAAPSTGTGGRDAAHQGADRGYWFPSEHQEGYVVRRGRGLTCGTWFNLVPD